ncbi:MAG TPA: DNA methyltransferase [Paenisporosarcina sp.]|nr:DNA methyltransferase [Paenisporosarcina sp.]
MTTQLVLSFYEKAVDIPPKKRQSEWGTFKDSLRAPVHRWFTYPAGFSYKAVEHSIERFNITSGDTIYDPFMGSGTTNLTAKTLGISSVGTEAHPFVYPITKAKLNWDIEPKSINEFIELVQKKLVIKSSFLQAKRLQDEFPELILKCYEDKTLYDLWALRELVVENLDSDGIKEFFFVVVTAMLRNVSIAATGWPYIAPNKVKTSSIDKDVLAEFVSLANQMAKDIQAIKLWSKGRYKQSEHNLINGDSRDTTNYIQDKSIDHVFTSPPYLNNFDYADRTRLELYFWGQAKSWGEISEKIRTVLITSATTQINRADARYEIMDEFSKECPQVTGFIGDSVEKLSKIRKTKGGKKSYDLMVAGYFNDMYLIIKDVYRVMKPATNALFVLGDSAPYGIHIPTDKLIGDIGIGIGFSSYEIEILRTRGDKWKANPQRHNIPLHEGIVILSK